MAGTPSDQAGLIKYIAELKAQGKTESTSKKLGKAVIKLKQFTPEKFDLEAGGGNVAILQRGVENPTPETAKDVTPYLADYQQGLFDQASIPALKKQLEPATGLPEPLDRSKMFEELRLEQGLPDLEAQLIDIKDQIEAEFNVIREQRGIEEGKPVAMGVISGRINEEERVAQIRIDALQRTQARITDELGTKLNVIGQFMEFESLDYADAVDRYDKEFSRNLALYQIIDEEMDEQEARARSNLQIYQNAILSGNLDYSRLSTDQKIQIQKLEIQSGLPAGFTASLRVSGEIISTTTRTSGGGKYVDIVTKQPDGTMKVDTQYLGASTEGGGGKPTEAELGRNAVSDMSRTLSENAARDGYVDSEMWKEARGVWINSGRSGSDFDDAFRSQYVNEYHYWTYGLPM